MFHNPNHLLTAHTEDNGFNVNTSRAAAFHEAAEEMASTENQFKEAIGRKPQHVKLPFKVEAEFHRPCGTMPDDEDLGWEVQLFDNDNTELLDKLGEATDHFVLSVGVVRVASSKAEERKWRIRKVDM